jgi:hypothetical protein
MALGASGALSRGGVRDASGTRRLSRRRAEWLAAAAGVGFGAIMSISAAQVGLHGSASIYLIAGAALSGVGAIGYIATRRVYALGAVDWFAIGYAVAIVAAFVLVAAWKSLGSIFDTDIGPW